MPKTTKDVTDKKNKKLNSKTTTSAKSSSSKVANKSKKSNTKTTAKKTTSTKKKSTSTVSKKVTSSKKNPSKKRTKSSTKAKSQKSINILEYYDLPYRYNETTVKILYQTPKTLFVYWDVSDSDRENFINQYGNDFFERTKPVLVIHNLTMNYTFEIDINDFANCWYFNINDEKCEYSVELGRKSKDINNSIIPNDYLYIASSNKIESPNGHILFDSNNNVVFFKNVKTNQSFSKDIAHFNFMKYFGKIYNIYDIYKKIYKEDEILKIDNPTSTFK